MRQEIERKFLMAGDGWRAAAGPGLVCRQGYIASGAAAATVRIRRIGDQGFLTIKGPSSGASRPEFEYEIPCGEADELLELFCRNSVVSKIRYTVPHGGHCWEVDVFSGLNEGLVLAEIELDSEEEPFERPDWLGAEVTGDPRYYNARLVREPWSLWPPAS